MSAVGWFFAAIGALILFTVAKVIVDLLNKEVQGRLPDLCFFILHLARRRIPEDLRQELFDELGLNEELQSIFVAYEKKPITGFVKGLRFSASYLLKVRQSVRIVAAQPPSSVKGRAFRRLAVLGTQITFAASAAALVGVFTGSWLLMVLVIFGLAHGLILRLVVLIYPREDPRRREIVAELYACHRTERPLYVAEQVETVLLEGFPLRARLMASKTARIVRNIRSFLNHQSEGDDQDRRGSL